MHCIYLSCHYDMLQKYNLGTFESPFLSSITLDIDGNGAVSQVAVDSDKIVLFKYVVVDDVVVVVAVVVVLIISFELRSTHTNSVDGFNDEHQHKYTHNNHVHTKKIVTHEMLFHSL